MQVGIRSNLLFAAIILLPWQARLILAERMIEGSVYEYGRISIYAVGVIALVAAVVLLREKEFPRRGAIEWCWFVGVLAVSSVFALDVPLAFAAAVASGVAALYAILGARMDRNQLLSALVVMGVLQAVIGWMQFISQSIEPSTILGIAAHDPRELGQSVVSIYGGRFLRAYGLLPHPNIFGGFLAVAFIASCIKFLGAPRGERHFTIALFSAAFLISGVLISFSRGALLAAIAGLIALAIQHHGRNSFIRVGQLVAVLAALFFSYNTIADNVWYVRLGLPFGGHAVQERLDSISAGERLVALHEAEVILDQKTFFLGTGPGNYVATVAQAFPSLPVYAYQPIHNAIALFILEIGSIGTLVLLWRLVRRRAITFRESVNRVLPYLYQPFFWALLIIAVVDHYLWTQFSGFALIFLLFGFMRTMTKTE